MKECEVHDAALWEQFRMSFMFSVLFLCQHVCVKEDNTKTTEWISTKVHAGIKHGQSEKAFLEQTQKSCTLDIFLMHFTLQIFNDVPIIISMVSINVAVI